jgi:hypothetical protein
MAQMYSGNIEPFRPNEPPTFVATKRILSAGMFIISAANAREPDTPCVGAQSVKAPFSLSKSARQARGSIALTTMRLSVMRILVTCAAAAKAAATFSDSPK